MGIPPFSVNAEDLGHKWGCVAALVYTPAATLASALILGWLTLFSSIVEAVQAFQARGWGGALLHVAGAALGMFIGLLVVMHPIAGALAWILLFASLFTVIGLLRIVATVWLRYRSWEWAVFDGIVSFPAC